MRQCPWILQAPTMSAAIGTKNKIGTRVERREKGSDRLPPYPSAGSGESVASSLTSAGGNAHGEAALKYSGCRYRSHTST